MSKQKIMEKLDSLFKEEMWGRIEPKDIGISKFKILDDLFNAVVSEDAIQETMDACRKHLEDHPEFDHLDVPHRARSATILIGPRMRSSCGGSLKYSPGTTNGPSSSFIAEKILEYGESSAALRAHGAES